MNRYSQPGGRSPVETAKVITGKPISLAGSAAWRELRTAYPCGIDASPTAGEEVLLLPLASGEMVVLGTLRAQSDTPSGELVLQNAMGASIRLKSDGSISLNGLIIRPDGQIQN